MDWIIDQIRETTRTLDDGSGHQEVTWTIGKIKYLVLKPEHHRTEEAVSLGSDFRRGSDLPRSCRSSLHHSPPPLTSLLRATNSCQPDAFSRRLQPTPSAVHCSAPPPAPHSSATPPPPVRPKASPSRCVMNKSWTRENNRFSESYKKGVQSFLLFAIENAESEDNLIQCPCRFCNNTRRKSFQEVRKDLHRHGFSHSYSNEEWIFHGERDSGKECEGDNNVGDDFDMMHEQNGGLDDLLNDIGAMREEEGETESLRKLRENATLELYPGCGKSLLRVITELLHIKVMNKWSNTSFEMLLKSMKDTLPKGHRLPTSYYAAKKFLDEIGTGYNEIDVCKNDCALFYKENEDKENCPVCGDSRWEFDDGKGNRTPHKILRHFPLKPRLQKLFMSIEVASDMRWHKNERVDEEGVMRHPADSPAWKHFDKFSSGIGVIVRGHADIGKTIAGWEHVTDLSKDFCYARLGHLFDIEECDTVRVQHIIDSKFRRAYTSWRYTLHTAYNSLKNKGISPRSISPRKDVTLEKWQLACDFIEDDKYQKRSRVNIENRDKMLYNQKTGRTPFLSRFKNMEVKSEIEFFKSSHVENSAAKLKYDEMVEMREKGVANGESVIESDIVKSTLGHKSGYVKGMGHGLQVSHGITSSMIAGIAIKEKLNELDKANEKIVDLTNKCEEQTNAVNSMKDQMSKWQKIIEMIPGVSQMLIDVDGDGDEEI